MGGLVSVSVNVVSPDFNCLAVINKRAVLSRRPQTLLQHRGAACGRVSQAGEKQELRADFTLLPIERLHNDTAMDLKRLLFIYSFIRLSGAEDSASVRQVPAQRGQSAIIPCSYNQKYAFSCKYVSAGHFWLLSDYAALSERKAIFISDDPSRHVFSIRRNKVQVSSYYWCAVHIPSAFDKRATFFINVTAESPRLHVSSQNVTAPVNGSVTITCYHRGQSGVKWCKFGCPCITRASGTSDGASVEIRYGLRNTTVIMSRLKKKNMGWYWCSAEDQQMPVHVTVDQNKSDNSPVTTESDQILSSARKRTAVLFLLSVILEILLMIIIYLALKLFKFCKKRFLRSEDEEEEGQYVMMHRSQTSRSYGCAAAEGTYENMAELKTNTECLREPLYVNIMKK
ncbi:polymeric immunoglobulin receptor isoform X2 [Puntigrus tetrazona]|uniref:polymeric immunoglobulin receptor isoform X2 n=1 Tax=Puntigrus tetrazona TaxID=1606681 RepID=UPI001C8A6F25|nr:polymeric immunoglobulin receptor isoform X2 [Puntigrus tetrazona]XP_043081816.1 polymeric immunoglobulin receptor isoform X2 [Puntigrus tetrazona]